MIQLTRGRLCEAIHQQLDRLREYNTKPTAPIPRDGIYFWYEAGEVRQGQVQRVTRVGTHNKCGRLHNRIREYYSLNREGSVFRKHVGGALMNRDGEPEPEIQEWYKGRSSPRFDDQKFLEFETRVTHEARRATYRVLKVENERERLGLEEKLIALFSHCKHCRASSTWLGNWAYRSRIRQSGLWNVRYVFPENEFEPSDLARLEQLVLATVAPSIE